MAGATTGLGGEIATVSFMRSAPGVRQVQVGAGRRMCLGGRIAWRLLIELVDRYPVVS
jgi:hypothetical protein